MSKLADLLVPYFDAHTSIVAALLFGSAATERLRIDSDLDLVLLFVPEQEPDAVVDGTRMMLLPVRHAC